MNVLYHAGSVPSALMAAALHNQDLLCRVFGKCLVGDMIDLEVGDLKNTVAPGGGNLFTYMRYNAELTEIAGLMLDKLQTKVENYSVIPNEACCPCSAR